MKWLDKIKKKPTTTGILAKIDSQYEGRRPVPSGEKPLDIIKEFLKQDIEDMKKLRKDLEEKYPELCGGQATEEKGNAR